MGGGFQGRLAPRLLQNWMDSPFLISLCPKTFLPLALGLHCLSCWCSSQTVALGGEGEGLSPCQLPDM